MGREGEARGDHPSLSEVRGVLRDELTHRGYPVASDSHGLHSELYVVGDDDLARALFEFAPTAAEACDRMYRSGSWVAGMPPRFAVLPASEAAAPALEMLEQIGVVALFFEIRDGRLEFPALDELLTAHLAK